MVELEQLEALDLLLWMGGSHRAAPMAHTNQSTILRRAHVVLSTFGVDIRRDPAGWNNSGQTALLAMERQVHQRFRFLGRGRLRLHVPFWSMPLVREALPEGWIHTPSSADHVCENPVELLRDRILDACLVTPTQMPADTSGLEVFEIYRSPIDLTVFLPPAGGDSRVCLERARNEGRLRLFPFLPRTCREISRLWFDRLHPGPARPEGGGAAHPEDGLTMAFLTPQMREAVGRPCLIDPSAPRDYFERLLVRAENASEPLFLALLDRLQRGCLVSSPAMPSQHTTLASNP
jgi:hypothetical protein